MLLISLDNQLFLKAFPAKTERDRGVRKFHIAGATLRGCGDAGVRGPVLDSGGPL